MIIARVNTIIKKGLDFQNNHDLLLTLDHRDIGPRMKDIDMIILAPKIIHIIKNYK